MNQSGEHDAYKRLTHDYNVAVVKIKDGELETPDAVINALVQQMLVLSKTNPRYEVPLKIRTGVSEAYPLPPNRINNEYSCKCKECTSQ